MNTIAPARLNLAALNIDVTHSKIEAANLNEDTLRDPSWHALVAAAYKAVYDHLSRKGFQHLEILRELSDISGAMVKPGEHSQGSYIYCSAIRASIQRRCANQSLRIAKQLAQAIGCSFEIGVRMPYGSPRWGGEEIVLWWTPDAVWEL